MYPLAATHSGTRAQGLLLLETDATFAQHRTTTGGVPLFPSIGTRSAVLWLSILSIVANWLFGRLWRGSNANPIDTCINHPDWTGWMRRATSGALPGRFKSGLGRNSHDDIDIQTSHIP